MGWFRGEQHDGHGHDQADRRGYGEREPERPLAANSPGHARVRHGRISQVTGTYSTAITVVALFLAAWTLVGAAANRPRGVVLLAAGLVLEALLVGFAVGGVVQMAGSERDLARAEFVMYLVGLLAIPPAAFVWAWGEKSRAGTAVIALAFLITPVMVLRVQQVWAGSVG